MVKLSGPPSAARDLPVSGPRADRRRHFALALLGLVTASTVFIASGGTAELAHTVADPPEFTALRDSTDQVVTATQRLEALDIPNDVGQWLVEEATLEMDGPSTMQVGERMVPITLVARNRQLAFSEVEQATVSTNNPRICQVGPVERRPGSPRAGFALRTVSPGKCIINASLALTKSKTIHAKPLKIDVTNDLAIAEATVTE